MALLELTLQSTYLGQEVINRFNYLSVGTPAAVSLSFALTHAFGCLYDTLAVPPGYPAASVFDAIRSVQSSNVSYDQVTAIDVYSNTDFYETPFIQSALGKRAGESMPSFVAVGFRTGRVRRDIRRGTKRFAGIPEADLAATSYTGAYQALLTTLAQSMSTPITYNDEGNTITFTPVVVGKEKYTPDPLRPERQAYRYYATLQEQSAHLATGIVWDWYTSPRSQVSRQAGKGR